MRDMSRREAIASIAAGSAGVVLSVSSESRAQGAALPQKSKLSLGHSQYHLR